MRARSARALFVAAQPDFYLVFTSPEVAHAYLPVLNPAVSLLTRFDLIAVGRTMLAKTGVNMRIDAVHARAICAEIGDHLREMLRPEVSSELPPSLQYLTEQLAKADQAPSLVPSLDDMIEQAQQKPIRTRQKNSASENFDAQMA